MKIEGYEEIRGEEYNELPVDNLAYFKDVKTDKTIYFKKAQKLPIVFEDKDRKIEVNETGIWVGRRKVPGNIHFSYVGSFPLLVKAVEKAKEVMKKNEKRI